MSGVTVAKAAVCLLDRMPSAVRSEDDVNRLGLGVVRAKHCLQHMQPVALALGSQAGMPVDLWPATARPMHDAPVMSRRGVAAAWLAGRPRKGAAAQFDDIHGVIRCRQEGMANRGLADSFSSARERARLGQMRGHPAKPGARQAAHRAGFMGAFEAFTHGCISMVAGRRDGVGASRGRP